MRHTSSSSEECSCTMVVQHTCARPILDSWAPQPPRSALPAPARLGPALTHVDAAVLDLRGDEAPEAAAAAQAPGVELAHQRVPLAVDARRAQRAGGQEPPAPHLPPPCTRQPDAGVSHSHQPQTPVSQSPTCPGCLCPRRPHPRDTWVLGLPAPDPWVPALLQPLDAWVQVLPASPPSPRATWVPCSPACRWLPGPGARPPPC